MSYKMFLAFIAGILIAEAFRAIQFGAISYNSEKAKAFLKRFMEH